MEKLLTVIVPCYNVEQYLFDVLKSYVIPKVFNSFEVLIVNDGSNDHSADIADSFCRKYPNCFRLINKENGGHGSTINIGIKYALGKYVRVIDGDDWVDKKCFVRFLEKLAHLDADLVLTPFNIVTEGKGITEVVNASDSVLECWTMNANDAKKIIKQMLSMHSFTVKTEILKKIPSISEHCFYVDNEFVVFSLAFIRTVAYINECVYQYRMGIEGQSVSFANLQKNRGNSLRVFNRIVDFEKSHSDVELSDIIRMRSVGLANFHLEILLFMPVARSVYHEVIDFLNTIDKKAPWILRKISLKHKLLLLHNYNIYLIVAGITHVRMKKNDNGRV